MADISSLSKRNQKKLEIIKKMNDGTSVHDKQTKDAVSRRMDDLLHRIDENGITQAEFGKKLSNIVNNQTNAAAARKGLKMSVNGSSNVYSLAPSGSKRPLRKEGFFY